MKANHSLCIALATAWSLSFSLCSCDRSEDTTRPGDSSSKPSSRPSDPSSGVSQSPPPPPEPFSYAHIRLGTLPPEQHYKHGGVIYRQEVLRIALSPESKLVAGASPDGMVRVWNIASRKMLFSRQTTRTKYGRRHTPPIAFSPDGEALVIVDGGRLVFVSPIHGAEIRSYDILSSCAGALCYSPNGTHLAILSMDRNVAPEATDAIFYWNTIRVHNARTGKVVLSIPKLHDSQMAYLPGRRRIASWQSRRFGPGCGTSRIWDTDTGRKVQGIEGETFAFSPDCKTVAAHSSKDGKIHLRNMIDGTESVALNLIYNDNVVGAMTFSPDGKTLAVAAGGGSDSDGHRWRIYDVRSGAVIAMGSEHEAAVRAIAFSKSGDLLVTGSEDTTIVVRKLPDHVRRPKPIAKTMYPKPFMGKCSHLGALAFSPDSKRVLSPGPDKSVVMWDMETMKPLCNVGGYGRTVWSLTWSRDGQRVLVGPFDGTIRVWNPTTRQQLKQHVLPRTSELYGPYKHFMIGGPRILGASPDCVWAVCKIGESQALWTFNTKTGRVGVRFDGHTGPVRCVAVSADAGKIASGSRDTTVRVWDAATGRCLHKFTGHDKPVRCVAFSSDGRYVVSGSDDKTVRVWDLKTGGQKHCLKGHLGHVACLAVTPDGRRVLSGAWEEVLRLWDIETGRQIPMPRFYEVRQRITYVAISPDSAYAVYSENNGTLWKRRVPK